MIRFLPLAFLFSIQTAIATEICVIGDSGTGGEKQYKVAKVMLQTGCKNIIHTGDIIYPDGVKGPEDPQFQEKFEIPYKDLIGLGSIFYLVLGNHDYKGSPNGHLLYAADHPHYKMPTKYYHFALGDICFWALDTNLFHPVQKYWLRDSMGNTSNCSWKVAFAHHPIRSSGKHGNAVSWLQSQLKPTLQKYAHIYLSGHDHDLADEGFVASSKYQRAFWQIVSGAAAQTRPVSCRTEDCRFASSDHGFALIKFDAEFADLKFINDEGEELYHTLVSKKDLEEAIPSKRSGRAVH